MEKKVRRIDIITYVQFSLTPIETIFKSNPKLSRKNTVLSKIESFFKFFNSPIDFIHQYNQIVPTIRTSISTILVFSGITFLFSIFFYPSWKIVLFFFDLFIPALFSFGIVFIIKKYNDYLKTSYILIIIGSIYFLVRIISFIYPLFFRKNYKWHIKCSHLITSVFLSRLKKDKTDKDLDSITQQIHSKINQNEYSILFDENKFTYKQRIIDFIITFIIWLFILKFVILGWKKLLEKQHSGKQLEDISNVSNLITYALFFIVSIRFVINIIWLVKLKENLIFKIFKILKGYSYKGMNFIAGVSILPIIKTTFSTFYISEFSCDWFSYYDQRANADSFLQYFMEKSGSLCVNCTKTSANNVYPCNQLCFFDPNVSDLKYIIIKDSPYILYHEFEDIYYTPFLINEFYYLCIFIVIFLKIYKVNFEILKNLPGPTLNIECKFQTLINTLTSAPVQFFHSYSYNYAFYYFSFTAIKLFTAFWAYSIFWGLHDFGISFGDFSTFIFSFACIMIGISQIYFLPYISILHNIVNFVSYIISGILSFFVALFMCNIIVIPRQLVLLYLFIIIMAPILTYLIVPFFVKKNPLLAPTKFELVSIYKWDKKLNQILKFRHDKSEAIKKRKNNENNYNFNFDENGILQDDEPSISIAYYQNNENEEIEHDYLIGQFDLIKIAPIQIQEQINKIEYDKNGNICENYKQFLVDVHNTWSKIDIYGEDFVNAVNEMLESSNKLLDSISYKNIISLFRLSMIFSSLLFGYIFASGVVRWKNILGQNGNEYYVRCNMYPNGTYPTFGSY